MNIISNELLTSLVIDLDNNIFAKIFERDLAAQPGPKVPDFAGPLLKLKIVGHTAFQRNRLILSTSGGLAATTRIAAFAVLDHFGSAFERANLADAGHNTSVPLDKKLKILVWIESQQGSKELCHLTSSPYGPDI